MTGRAKRGLAPLLLTATVLCLLPGSGRALAQPRRLAPSFRTGDPIVATTYFYWYDVNPADIPRIGYTAHPPSWEDFSWRSIDWHKRQLVDMEYAGIDVVLPVFFGSPRDSDRPDDPIYWVYGGLRKLVEARQELLREGRRPPSIGMFYDTTTLTTLDAEAVPRIDDACQDLTTDAGKDWFYNSIARFFALVPEEHRALIDGKPLVFLYQITFARAVDESLFPYVQGRFERDNGTRLFLVKDRETIGSTLSQDQGIRVWADKILRGELTETRVLAEVLASEEFYRRTGGTPAGFATRLARDVFGGQPPPVPPSGDLETPAGRLAWAEGVLLGPSREQYHRRLVADLYKLLLGRPEPLDVLVRGMAAGEFVDREMFEALRALNDGMPPAGVRAEILAGPAFLTKAGNTTAGFIHRLYETALWRSPESNEVDLWTGKIERHLQGLGLPDLAAAPQVRSAIAAEFLATPEATGLVVARWYAQHLGRRPGWPGYADSVYNWLGSVTPGFFDVASIGPGYDDTYAPGRRGPVRVDRRGGRRYADAWETLLAMRPRPSIVHVETWNEYHEATNVAESLEHGRQYLDMTRDFVARFHAR